MEAIVCSSAGKHQGCDGANTNKEEGSGDSEKTCPDLERFEIEGGISFRYGDL
jgi:hypothetical protein